MGLFATGPSPLRVNSDQMAAEMTPAVLAFADAHVRIVDPDSTETTPYDPLTDTGGESVAKVVWDSGPEGAIVQPIRSQTIGDYGAQAVGLVAVRIQAAVPEGVGLRSGLQVRVIDGGSDHESERHTYVIGSGIDSSLRWVTRILATVVAT